VNTGNSCSYSANSPGGFGGNTYSWSTDGTITDGQGTSAVYVTFGTDGSHSVEVQVTDSQGATAYSSLSVTSQTTTELTCDYM